MFFAALVNYLGVPIASGTSFRYVGPGKALLLLPSIYTLSLAVML